MEGSVVPRTGIEYAWLRGLFPQPAIGLLAALVVALAVWLSDAAGPPIGLHTPPSDLVLAAFLVGGAIVTRQFPIHMRLSAKIHMGTVVYFLMAALLPVSLAVVAAAIGVSVAEWSVRSRTGNYPSDIAAQAGQVVASVAVGSTLAHLQFQIGPTQAAPLLLAALAMWLADILVSSLVYGPLTGEPVPRVVVAMVREGGLAEAAQYLIALLGVFAALREMWTVLLLVLPIALVYLVLKRAKEMQDGTRQMLESLADTVDLRDPYTGGHSRRVTELAADILRVMEKYGAEADLITWAARVHDIGKIAIPDEVLNKAEDFTTEERAVMESHALRGAEFLGRYPDFRRGVDIVRHHHEHWDGSGYPHRLDGWAIPFGARIIAVADSYDAMTSDRPYRLGMPSHEAAGILLEGRGRQWDPAVVDAFLLSIADRLEQPPLVMAREEILQRTTVAYPES